MGTVEACHKCKKFINVDDSYEGQMGTFLFERDHRGHMMGHIDSAEVGSYQDVSDKYSPAAKKENEKYSTMQH